MTIRQLFKSLFASDKNRHPAKAIVKSKDTRVFDETLSAVKTAARRNKNPELKVISDISMQMIWVAWEENSFLTYGAPGVKGAHIFLLIILENHSVSVLKGLYGPTYTVKRINESILSKIRNYHLYK